MTTFAIGEQQMLVGYNHASKNAQMHGLPQIVKKAMYRLCITRLVLGPVSPACKALLSGVSKQVNNYCSHGCIHSEIQSKPMLLVFLVQWAILKA